MDNSTDDRFDLTFPCFAIVLETAEDKEFDEKNVTFETPNGNAVAIFTDEHLADDFRIDARVAGKVRELAGPHDLLHLLKAQEPRITLVGVDCNPKTNFVCLIDCAMMIGNLEASIAEGDSTHVH